MKILLSSSIEIIILFGRQQTLQSSMKSCLPSIVKSIQTEFDSPQYWQIHTKSSSVVCFFSIVDFLSITQVKFNYQIANFEYLFFYLPILNNFYYIYTIKFFIIQFSFLNSFLDFGCRKA